jgi:hypothetical protein
MTVLYNSEYIPNGVCDVRCVGRCSILNKCPVALCKRSVFVRLRIAGSRMHRPLFTYALNIFIT